MDHIDLTPKETDEIIKDRSQGRPANERTGFIGIIEWQDGPRGGKYAPSRTALHLNEEDALDALDVHIRTTKQTAKTIEVYEVYATGDTVDSGKTPEAGVRGDIKVDLERVGTQIGW